MLMRQLSRAGSEPKTKPAFRLTRFFSIASFLGILVVLVVLLLFYRHFALNALTEHETRGNAALARVFANTIWPKHAAYVQGASAIPPAELAQRVEAVRLRQDVLEQMAGLSVVKVKIYNLAGLTVFTDARQIGEDRAPRRIPVCSVGAPPRDHLPRQVRRVEQSSTSATWFIVCPDPQDRQIAGRSVIEVYSDVTLSSPSWRGPMADRRRGLVSLSLLYAFCSRSSGAPPA